MSSPAERLIAGRYRLRRPLGQGAMGTVWEAYDEFLRRRVAVKEVLAPTGISAADAAELRERTLREARAIAALSHPNVITLHDVAREGDEPFVVTEYLAAYNLATLLAVLGPLDPPRVAAIADAVAAGLAAAHQAGITHRDVKPGNVLVCADGQVKLTDFGIARNAAERTLTSTGIMLGSPSYIAPEVASGGEVAPAADLWGLGATVFAAVEGRPPYDGGGTVLEIVNQVVHGEVPRPTSAGPLAPVIAALMVKDPTRRSALVEVRDRLHRLLPPPSDPLLSEADLRLLARAGYAPDGPGPVLAASAPAPTSGDEPTSPRQRVSAAPGTDPADSDTPDRAADGTGAQPADPADPTSDDPASDSPAGDGPTGSADDGSAGGGAAPSLAPAPGPLPFTPARRVRRRRGALGTAVLVVVSVVLFALAGGGGFALARLVGGESPLPPVHPTSSPPPRPESPLDELKTQTGDAATVAGAQGGGYAVDVPADWVRFVEERVTDELSSTRVYFVSPDGTRALTIERIPAFYPDHSIDSYVADLGTQPDVVVEESDRVTIPSIGPGEPAQQLTYRTTVRAESLAAGDPNARDLNRVTFAQLLPLRGDLWIVAVTVPVDQEDTGRFELFDAIARTFRVTG